MNKNFGSDGSHTWKRQDPIRSAVHIVKALSGYFRAGN